jgi:hypothetical protein
VLSKYVLWIYYIYFWFIVYLHSCRVNWGNLTHGTNRRTLFLTSPEPHSHRPFQSNRLGSWSSLQIWRQGCDCCSGEVKNRLCQFAPCVILPQFILPWSLFCTKLFYFLFNFFSQFCLLKFRSHCFAFVVKCWKSEKKTKAGWNNVVGSRSHSAFSVGQRYFTFCSRWLEHCGLFPFDSSIRTCVPVKSVLRFEADA